MNPYNDGTLFEREYSRAVPRKINTHTGDGHPFGRVSVGYCRWNMKALQANYAQKIAIGLKLDVTARIVLVGCGFGWGLETLRDRYRVAEVAGVDTSEWIHANKDLCECDYIEMILRESGIPDDHEESQHTRSLLNSVGCQCRETGVHTPRSSVPIYRSFGEVLFKPTHVVTERCISIVEDPVAFDRALREAFPYSEIAHLTKVSLPIEGIL